MRLPRIRFTIKWMMIAVACMAFLTVGGQTVWRWLDYRGQYRQYAEFERISREQSLHPQVGVCALMEYDEDTLRSLGAASARYSRQLADHYLQLSEKYALAMSRPWLPVTPDPPTPE
jgi:hypothetical protein